MTVKIRLKNIRQGGATDFDRLQLIGTAWSPHREYFQFEVNEGEVSNTSSGTPVTALDLVTPDLPADDYEIGGQWSFRHSVLNGDQTVSIRFPASTFIIDENEYSCSDTSVEQRWPSAAYRRFALSGVNTIRMELLNSNGSGTAYMYNRRMYIRRMRTPTVPIAVVAGNRPRLKNIAQDGADANHHIRWDQVSGRWAPRGYFQEARDFSRSTTTSTTFSQKLRLTTLGSMPEGKYLIRNGFTWDRSNASGDAGFRVQIDDTTEIENRTIESPSGDSSMRHACSTFAVADLTAGVHTIDLDFKDFNNLTATVGIQSAWTSIELVGPPAGN